MAVAPALILTLPGEVFHLTFTGPSGTTDVVVAVENDQITLQQANVQTALQAFANSLASTSGGAVTSFTGARVGVTGG